MMMNALKMKKIYPYLIYAGLIPFIGLAICLSFGINSLLWLGSTEKILSVYALVIANFLAGICWGHHLHLQGKWSQALPILSNIIVIVLWLSFLILGFGDLIVVFIVTFIMLLIIDYKLFQDKVITHQYFQVRCFITMAVILSLIVSGI